MFLEAMEKKSVRTSPMSDGGSPSLEATLRPKYNSWLNASTGQKGEQFLSTGTSASSPHGFSVAKREDTYSRGLPTPVSSPLMTAKLGARHPTGHVWEVGLEEQSVMQGA